MSEDELIEKAAKAAYEGAFLKHAPEEVDRWEDLVADNDPAAESWREVARHVLAVFREHTAPTYDERSEIEKVLRGNGITDRPDLFDSDIHSWRCEYPERYGGCTCFSELVDELMAVRRGAPAEPAVTDKMADAAHLAYHDYVVGPTAEPLRARDLGVQRQAWLVAVRAALEEQGKP